MIQVQCRTVALRGETFGRSFPKESRSESENEPTVSSESRQKGLLGRAQKPAAAGCPIDFEQAAQFEFLPQRRAQQGEEPDEAVAPLAQPRAEAQQDVRQERRPHLPAHRIGRVAQKVRQLEGLFELLEEDLNFPAATVKISDGLRAPFQVVREKGHLPQLAIHLDPRHHAAQLGQPDGRSPDTPYRR